MNTLVQTILEKYDKDSYRLMDILIDVQKEMGFISDQAVKEIATAVNLSEVDVEQTISFYHFFHRKPAGKYQIYLNDSAMSVLKGHKKVKEAFENACGIKFGQVTADGTIGLFNTACIGMSDQEPAALINGVMFPELNAERVVDIISGLKAGKQVEELFYKPLGDGKNSSKLIHSMANNNILRRSIILEESYVAGTALKTAVVKSDIEIIGIVKTSNLRGRGGAGFPTGMKWEFCRLSKGDHKYIFCNADEGEPGTFKDRVIMTEKADMMFEGMAIAGYAIGAKEGVLYIRYEYKYLENYLESVLSHMREKKLLGKNILGKAGFDFDVRIQFGAGAYVCGEESALIESAEGKRGEPRDKPPFPVQSGYLNMPTSVNNVETFCSVCRIIEKGGEWYNSMGTEDSKGTKVLSISGDCRFPGIYEVEWGMSLAEICEMVDATDVQAMQVAGPSGALVHPSDFHRKICYNDYATGGSMMIFNSSRNLLKDVVGNFMEFFIDESCGSCSTCRIIPSQLNKKLQKVLSGHGIRKDIDDMIEWSKILSASRCGLGTTAHNPITTSIKNFPHLYENLIQKDVEFDECFNMETAVKESCRVVGRPVLVNH